MDANSVLTGEAVSLRRLLVGSRDGDGTYSGIVTVYGSTGLTMNVTTQSAIRYGDGGQRLASYARITGGTITMVFSGDFSTIGAVLGLEITTEGTTPNRIRRIPIYNRGLPYFGLAGAADLEDGSEFGVHVFAPKCQVVADSIQILSVGGGENAEFRTVSMDITVLPDELFEDGYADEVQHLALGTPSTGTYTLTLGGQSTTALAYNADAAAIEAALEALPLIGADNVTVVAGTPSGFDITFVGRLASSNMPLLTGTGAGGFDGTIAITQTTPGASGFNLFTAIYEVEAGYIPALPPVFGAVA